MSIALISLIALGVAIILSIVRQNLNIGIVSIAFALIIGFFSGEYVEKDIISLFPSTLFIMLVGITALFSIASVNGTLEHITYFAMKCARGNTAILPIVFFLLSLVISAIGPGNIATVALIGPVAMIVAYKTNVSPLLMAIMVCTGANAGGFSPVSPTGIIAVGLMDTIGIDGIALINKVFISSAVLQSFSAIVAYLLFKGYKSVSPAAPIQFIPREEQLPSTVNFKERITFVAILALVVAVVVFKLSISLVSFTLVGLLLLFQVADGDAVIKKIPWDSIILVTGVSVLVQFIDKTGGLEIASTMIAHASSPETINTTLAFVTGVISAFSSSSGIVMPTFIPLVPDLIEKLGNGDIANMVTAICVGSHMVDTSPLSTLGAICIAAYPLTKEKNKLFRNLLLRGLSMAFLGAFIVFVFLDLL